MNPSHSNQKESNQKESHQHKDPLHGITLETLLTDLVAHYGWEELGRRIAIRCFNHDPSIKSSLKFLRKTPWARAKTERLYLKMLGAPIPRHLNDSPAKVSTEQTTAKTQVNQHIWDSGNG